MQTVQTLDELVRLVEREHAAGRAVYVRYSRGPALDGKRGVSLNHQTGQREAGLSVNGLTEHSDLWGVNGHTATEYVATAIYEYVYLLMQGGRGTYPWLLTGTEVARGSDNEPLVQDWQPVARVAPAVLDEARAEIEARRARERAWYEAQGRPIPRHLREFVPA